MQLIVSGNTTLSGAVVTGHTVNANVGTNPSGSGGNLIITSLQDTSSFNEASRSQGGSITLNGGQITSSQAAVDARRNTFNSTGGTTITDIQNTAVYGASGSNLTLGYACPVTHPDLTAPFQYPVSG